MFIDSTQAFHYNSSNGNGRNSTPALAKISISAETFHYNIDNSEYSLPLSHIIGVSLVNAHIFKNSNRKKFNCGGGTSSLKKDLNLAVSAMVKPSTAASTSSTNVWMIFAFVITKSKRGDVLPPTFERILFSSESETNGGTSALECVQKINDALGYFAPDLQGRKILLIANPFGGAKKALKTYHEIVLPVIKLAGLEEHHEFIATTHANHATEIGRTLDYTKYRALATISGDGVFHELLNGVLSRKDWEACRSVPLGIIGAGTSNALGQNLDLANCFLATLALVKGKSQKMDVMSCIQNNVVSYSHLMCAWTLLADVDIESDRFRSLGPVKIVLAVLIRLTKYRMYHGKLHILPDEGSSEFRLPVEAMKSKTIGPTGIYTAPNSENYLKWPLHVESTFQYFISLNMPWIATDFLHCPFTKIDDGVMDLLYTEKMSRSNILASFLDAERGVCVTLPGMKHHRVKAFVLEPGPYDGTSFTSSDNKNSQADLLKEDGLDQLILDVSGERVPYSKIQVEVLPGLVNIIVPTWLDSSRWEKNFHKDFPNFAALQGIS